MRPGHREGGKFGNGEQQAGACAMAQQQLPQSPAAAPAVVPTIVGSAFSPTRRVGARGGPQLFAQKLFTLVEEEDPEIVEWLPDGLAFRVKDIARFSTEVLEKYFNHSKFTSFQRQLNLYQFKRRKGAHAGAFHHPCFRRGQRHLLSKVRRQKVKRDLAVEARAAQRLARTRDASSHNAHRSTEHLSGRGRTRTASQADIRPGKNENDGDVSDENYEAESRRSGLRRRVDAGPSRDLSGLGNEETDASHHANWGKDGSLGMGHLSSAGRVWGEDWRHDVSGSPARGPRLLHDPSTPSSGQASDYTTSPSGSTTSDHSTSSSSLSLSASSPLHSELVNATSPQSQFDDEISHSETPSSDNDSPLSMHHSPVDAAVAVVQATQVSPSDNGLSLAAAVDATTALWQNSGQQQAKQQRPFEPFGWGGLGSEAEVPWSDSVQHGAPLQPHNQGFGFIDLFTENWDAGEDAVAPPPAGPSSPTMDDSRMEAFMKEAEAAGVFGVEEYFLPRGGGSTSASYGPAAFA